MAARHQAARLDIPVVQGVYLNFQRHRPSSGQTPRTRFKSILSDLGLTATGPGDGKPLDLVSMRAGGATWLLETTENGNLVQRRGWWISEKVMALYIQELTANIFLAQLSSPTKRRILELEFG